MYVVCALHTRTDVHKHIHSTLKWKQESVVTLKTRLWRKQREHVSRTQYRSCVHTHRQWTRISRVYSVVHFLLSFLSLFNFVCCFYCISFFPSSHSNSFSACFIYSYKLYTIQYNTSICTCTNMRINNTHKMASIDLFADSILVYFYFFVDSLFRLIESKKFIGIASISYHNIQTKSSSFTWTCYKRNECEHWNKAKHNKKVNEFVQYTHSRYR